MKKRPLAGIVWYEQFDGRQIGSHECRCHEAGELDCPIDVHRFRAIERMSETDTRPPDAHEHRFFAKCTAVNCSCKMSGGSLGCWCGETIPGAAELKCVQSRRSREMRRMA